MNIDLNKGIPFYHLPGCPDRDVEALAMRCIGAQREVADPRTTSPDALVAAKAAVSPAALERILAANDDIHGIAENAELSDVISFNASHLHTSVRSERVAELRRQLDLAMTKMLRRLLGYDWTLEARRSGHFWYPPGSHMAWHTNNKAPGWRVYLTCASEPGRSFFRYRDPRTGDIITTMDSQWDLRLFRVDPAQSLWHAVYSETDRFSFGYAVVIKPLIRAAFGHARSELLRVIRPAKGTTR